MKTGTTTDNFDKWCCAGTPYYVAAVWFGYDYNKEIKASGNPAGLIYKTVMDRVHKGLAVKTFEQYTDQVVQKAYCTSSGLLAGSGCTSKAMGWYKLSNLPGVCASCNGAPPVSENNETTSASNPETPTESTTAPVTETTTQPPATEPPANPETPAA